MLLTDLSEDFVPTLVAACQESDFPIGRRIAPIVGGVIVARRAGREVQGGLQIVGLAIGSRIWEQ